MRAASRWDAAWYTFELYVLCIPAMINGSPLVYADTRGYYLGGAAGIDKIAALLHPAAPAAGGMPVSEIRAARSVFFALYEFVTAYIGTLWLSTAIQGLILLLVLHLLFTKLCPNSPRTRFTQVVCFLGLFTTASWTVSYSMPDVFNAILSLGIMVTIVFWDRITPAQRFAVAVAIAASVTMHTTNLMTAALMLAVGVLLRWRLWPSVAVGGAVLAAVLAMLVVSRAGFHEWTVAPITPPFLTARVIADGPGRLYVRSHCPQAGWAICRYADRINVNSTDFLWHDNGVYSAYDLTPADRAELRAQDKRLYLAVAQAYPAYWLRTFADNVADQLAYFTLQEHKIPSWATYTRHEMTLYPKVNQRLASSVDATPETTPQRVWDVVIYATVLASIFYLLILAYRRQLTIDQQDIFILALAAVWLAALAGAFSEVAARYETRAIWLIPAVAALVLVRRLKKH